MKICKDCEHYSFQLGTSGECKAPQAYNIINYVTGGKSRDCEFCKIQRESTLTGYCGNSAAWFKLRKKRWYQLWR